MTNENWNRYQKAWRDKNKEKQKDYSRKSYLKKHAERLEKQKKYRERLKKGENEE